VKALAQMCKDWAALMKGGEGDEQLQASKRRAASRSLSPPTYSALGTSATPATPAMKGAGTRAAAAEWATDQC